MKAKGTFPYFIIPFPMIAIETRTSLSRFALKVAQITLSRKGRGWMRRYRKKRGSCVLFSSGMIMLLADDTSADAQVGGFAGALVGDEAYAIAVLLHHLAVAREYAVSRFQRAAEIELR
jgi:hypothetical protein